LAIALWWFWLERGYLSDGRRWVDALLALDGVEGQTGEAPHKLPARTKAYLLRVSGILAMAQGDHDRAVTLYKEAISAYREMGDKKGVSATLRDLGFVAYEKGDYERAVALQEQSLALAREFGIVWSMRALADAVRGREISDTRERCWKRAWLCLVARSMPSASRARSLASGAWRARQANMRRLRGCTKRVWSWAGGWVKTLPSCAAWKGWPS
jgi:tetratricopeptide (TPR) repeat protein